MTAWFTSRNGALTLTVLIAIGTSLALLSAIAAQGVSARTIAAALLVLCFVVFTFGGVLYAGRAFWNWQIGENSSHIIWERGFVIGGIFFTALGLSLLEELLRAAGEPVLSRLGMVTFLVGAVVVIAAETAYLAKRDWLYPQIVLYVVLAFLAQAAFGASLLQTGLVAGWAGWATVIWNIAWLLFMLILRPRDVYFPEIGRAHV